MSPDCYEAASSAATRPREGGTHGSNESVKLATPPSVDEKTSEKGTEFLYMWPVLILDSD